ncbi:glycosyltransferase family protein [Flaviflexus massiliensis]|uniref:hypothetical protein n=1 Tax=Flaviflexus massiliensis TaxID=1522309 RepID=UPI000A6F2525|nr:hypothetical protein [Flaviflexus massiliensis]
MNSKKRPSLLIISYSPIVSDARVFKQVRLFSDRYDITTCGYGPAPEGVVRHIQIPDELIYWRKDRKLLMARQYKSVVKRQEVNSFVLPQLLDKKFDVILVDDLDPVPVALKLIPNGGVHVDLHEYSPGQKQDDLKWRAFVAPYVSWVVRNYVTKADSVTTVCEGIANEYREQFGVEASVVVNATALHDLQPQAPSEPLRLVHSGACLRNRNLHVMIDAMEKVESDQFTLDFYLTPNDPGYLEELKQRASQVKGVTITDPVPMEELVPRLNEYDIGVFLLPPVNFNYKFALPNKFFDFVQSRLGIVIGPSPEMERLVHRYDLGAVTEEFTAESLAQTLSTITKQDVEKWKINSDRATAELSAERQSEAWVEAIDRLAARARKN